MYRTSYDKTNGRILEEFRPVNDKSERELHEPLKEKCELLTELWFKPQSKLTNKQEHSIDLTDKQVKEITRLLEKVHWRPSTRKGVGEDPESVSYTHLTLPTNREV